MEGGGHKILCMVTHHNFIFEFMRLFGRKENVQKKPEYLWTAAIELEYDTGEGAPVPLESIADRNREFRKVKVLDFNIIL